MKKRPQVTIDDLRAAGATVVSLARQPLNLKPAVDVITDVLRQRAMASGGMATVVFGENHRVSQHIALPLFTLSALGESDAATVGVGLEQPYNFLQRNLVNEKRCISVDDLAREAGCNDNGLMALKLMDILDIDRQYAPVANVAFDDTCLHHGVTVCFTDAAQSPCQKYLDPDDPDNAELLALADMEGARDIDMSSELGISIRNMVIAKNTFNHFSRMKVDYGLLRTGATHVFGETGFCEYEDSLAHIFGKIGMDAVYVLPVAKGIKEKDIPAEALNHARDMIVVTGLDERRFRIGDTTRETAHMYSLYYESGYISAEEYAASKRELGLS